MPSKIDWNSTPLAVIDQIFSEGSNPQWQSQVQQFFNEKFDENLKHVPSLNHFKPSELLDGQLVRFRGMVQDTFDPEMYLSQFEIKDLATGEARLATGKYRDLQRLGPKEEAMMDTAKAVNADRLSLYCVNVPGETPWVLDAHKKLDGVAKENNLKRQNKPDDGDEAMDVEMDGENKRAKAESGQAVNTGKAQQQQQHSVTRLNLPIEKDKNGKAVIVKVSALKVSKTNFKLKSI